MLDDLDNVPRYCAMIREEFMNRMRRNSAYSSRALARDMGITPGYLSQILSAKRTPRPERAVDIAKNLGWDVKKIREFVGSVQKSQFSDADSKAFFDVPSVESYTRVDLDAFELVSKWFYYVILEMTTLKDFKSSVRWVSNRLGLSPMEVRHAVDRLIQVGLLKVVDGHWRKTHATYETGAVPSSVVRDFHSQVLDQAKQALKDQAFEEIDFVGLTVGISRDKIPEAKALIEKFYVHFMEQMEVSPSDAVYQLNVGFFRVDRPSQGHHSSPYGLQHVEH